MLSEAPRLSSEVAAGAPGRGGWAAGYGLGLAGLWNSCLVAWAFVQRDFRTQVSYRAAFVMQFAGIFFSAATYFFMAQVFGTAVNPALQAYGGDYFAFLLIGMAFSGYLGLGLYSVTSVIREGQSNGTLELMLLSPTSLPIIVLGSSLWQYLMTSVRVLAYLLIGVFVFGMPSPHANVLAAVTVLLLSITCFGSIGVISASFVLVLKKGDPIMWVFGSLSSLLAGVYYPVGVLPDWLQIGSRLLPLTYSLEGMRLALLQGYSLVDLWQQLAVLCGFAAILLPLGLWSFRLAVRQAKIDGSLAQF